MPKYRAPDSDVTRVAFLKQTMETGREDMAAGRKHITQELLDEVNQFYPQLDAAQRVLGAALGERVREVKEADALVPRLEMYLRHIWDSVTNRAERTGQGGILQYYRLPSDGARPLPTSRKEWMRLAELVIAGDADAVATGYPAVVDPPASELQGVLNTLQSATTEVGQADAAYDEAQEALALLRPPADALIAEVVEVISFATRRHEPSSQRRILRRYGASYRYLPGEAPDPDDEATGTEEPATP